MFVISDKEQELLLHPGLSNEARVLYLLSLRPLARNGKVVIDTEELRAQMAVRDHRGGLDYPGEDEIAELLSELLAYDLIERKRGAGEFFEDGETVFLPAAERSRKIWLCR